jgi:hypothetical protein
MAKVDQIGTTSTSIITDKNYTKVIYHTTPVVKFNEKFIVLNNGGYLTNTTKLRMNQTSNEFGLNFFVYSFCRKWYVKCPNNKTIEFKNNMRIKR